VVAGLFFFPNPSLPRYIYTPVSPTRRFARFPPHFFLKWKTTPHSLISNMGRCFRIFRILVDTKDTFPRVNVQRNRFRKVTFLVTIFWKLAPTFARSSTPLITAVTCTKNHSSPSSPSNPSSPRSLSLSIEIHSELMDPPPSLQLHYLKKPAESLPDRESRKTKSNYAWNFKEKRSRTNEKLHT